MMSHEQNLRLAQTGPDAPCGEVLRRYWQPAALVEELEGPRPAKAVKLLGEDLVLFRDATGNGESRDYGLIGRNCPHRGVDLCYGRIEDGGLRCPFHGWLFDRHGACLDQPAEPAGSNFHTKIRHKSYPVIEVNGVLFAYLGDGDPPPLPACDAVNAPEPNSFAFKGFVDCNWLQALEVGIDPAHASFLHRFLKDESRDHGLQFQDTPLGTDVPLTKLLRDFDCPSIDTEETDFGLRILALRELSEAQTNVRITNLMFPNAIVIPMSRDMIITQWQVPVDDVTSYWYAMFTSFSGKVDKATMRAQRLELYTLPDYKPRIGKQNDYGFDADEQIHDTYTGMGHDINVHDQWAVESQGLIQDRTQEHLGTTDRAIIAYRKMLLAAIGAPGTVNIIGRGTTAPIAIDTVGPSDGWQDAWQGADAERRARSDWAQHS
jgi:phenylpropionate dioxygenase-like ring-hydroxylating dioxygenase large terminal subunit